jgi:hypothetical protein
MVTIPTSVIRGFYIGLAIGQIWLSLISTSFVSLLWILGQNTVQVSLIPVGCTAPKTQYTKLTVASEPLAVFAIGSQILLG